MSKGPPRVQFYSVGDVIPAATDTPSFKRWQVIWSWNPLDWRIRRGVWPGIPDATAAFEPVHFEWVQVGPLEVRRYRRAS